MSIKEFITELAEEIEVRNEGLRVTPTEMLKNNGCVQNGVTIYRKDENVAPVFWLDKFYEMFEEGELPKEDILERIVREYENLPTPNIPDMEEWMSSPEFLSRISIHLLNGSRNQKMIEERKLVSYAVENTDLVCLFYAKVFLDDNTLGEVAITERIMEEYLPMVKDVEELYHLVTEQVQAEEIRFESSLSVIERLFREKKIEAPIIPMAEDYMYILSNKQMTFGAGSILAKAVRPILLEHYPNGRITILPSSVHELILLDAANCGELKQLRDIVRQVNASEVSQADFLSDMVYIYDAKTGTITEYTEEEVAE